MKTIRIAIIEPSPALGCGLRRLIGGEDRFNVVGVYHDFVSFRIERVANLDIILINPLLVDFHTNVRECFPQEQTKAFLVAVPYGYINPEVLKGYDGELNLFDDREALTRQLKKIIGLPKPSGNDNDAEIRLTAREKEVVIAITHGLSSREIAQKMNLSKHTVAVYRKKIASKLGVKGAVGLSTYAHLNGLLKH
jgi:DNA-binding NarL/FixJ family response regulator